MQVFTTVFLLALGVGTLLQLWLGRRHIRHILTHRPRVPNRFSTRIPLDAHQKAADYNVAKVKLGRVDLLLGTVLLLFWTLGGGLDALQGFWKTLELDPLIGGTAFILSTFLIIGLIELPVSAWNTFVLEERFGFNRSTPKRFLQDHLLQALLLVLLGLPLVWLILWLMERAGSLWWLAAWLLWTGFTLLITWAYPILIAPLFNTFTALQEGSLKERIQLLLQRCGFTSDGIFVMDGSRRSGHGNAYFTGFGRHKRIVFFDTLVKQLSEAELEAVLAHELGHYRRRHVLKMILFQILISLLGFALLGWLIQQQWFYAGLGISTPGNAVALLLFLLVGPVFTLFFEPFASLRMRRYEFEADEYAVEQTGSESLMDALLNLYRDNASTLTPDPLYSAFHDSHPPAPVRIAHIAALESNP